MDVRSQVTLRLTGSASTAITVSRSRPDQPEGVLASRHHRHPVLLPLYSMLLKCIDGVNLTYVPIYGVVVLFFMDLFVGHIAQMERDKVR